MNFYKKFNRINDVALKHLRAGEHMKFIKIQSYLYFLPIIEIYKKIKERK